MTKFKQGEIYIDEGTQALYKVSGVCPKSDEYSFEVINGDESDFSRIIKKYNPLSGFWGALRIDENILILMPHLSTHVNMTDLRFASLRVASTLEQNSLKKGNSNDQI